MPAQDGHRGVAGRDAWAGPGASDDAARDVQRQEQAHQRPLPQEQDVRQKAGLL